jgi:hypothetical protein
MGIYDRIKMAQLAAKLRLNAANGNAVNGATPGAAVRPASGRAARPASLPVAGAAPSAKAMAPALPPSFAKLNVDVTELAQHLSNAHELYTAKSAVSRTANQLYGTMLDVVEDSDEFSDDMLGEDVMVEEGDLELGAEGIQPMDSGVDADQDSSGESGQVASIGFSASA